MDPKKDPLTPSSSKQDSPDVGTIRWAGESLDSTPATPTSQENLRSKVTHYEKIWSSGNTPSASGNQNDSERGTFSIDVNAFERRLQEERERRAHEQSPRIDIRLRTTPQPSPRQFDSPVENRIKVNIKHQIETSDGRSDGNDVVDHAAANVHRQSTRVVTYEKVLTQKSIREVNITRTKVQSPTTPTTPTQRIVEYAHAQVFAKSPSNEQITIGDDSAYHSHRATRFGSGGGTPTSISISSSNASLHQNFTSDENVSAHRTPSRERIFLERGGSEPTHSLSSIGSPSSPGNITTSIVYVGNEAEAARQQSVSPVAGSNEFVRRHLIRERPESSSDTDGISPDWYTEYQAHSFHTQAAHNPRMDFKRSNSQYDNHIRQIRGITQSKFHYILLFSIRKK